MKERLTTKMESGKNIVIGNKQEAIDRLAYYEDMEEQGRLVAVKCKECVYFENREGYTPYCAHPSCIVGDGVGEEFYCPNGERKNGIENALATDKNVGSKNGGAN